MAVVRMTRATECVATLGALGAMLAGFGWSPGASAGTWQPADLVGDGQVGVVDVQVLVSLALDLPLGAGVEQTDGGEPAPCVSARQQVFAAAFEGAWEAGSACPPVAPPSAPSSPRCGDLDADERVNVSDVLLALQMALGLPLSPSLDADQNGLVDTWQAAVEATLLLAELEALSQLVEHTGGCGAPCGAGALCCGGACVPDPSAPPSACGPGGCDDGDACTDDYCDEQLGACVHVPVHCDDGLSCTLDYCDPGVGCGAWPQDGACPHDYVCQPESAADPSGCVPGNPLGYCRDEPWKGVHQKLGTICSLGPPAGGAIWTPPAVGDQVVCEVRLAAIDLACGDFMLGCFARFFLHRLAWSSDLEFHEITAPHCDGEGCGWWPIPFGGQQAMGPNGVEYTVFEPSSEGELAHQRTLRMGARLPHVKVGGMGSGTVPVEVHPSNAYFSGEDIVGNPVLARLSLTVGAPPPPGGGKVCLVEHGPTSASKGISTPMPLELELLPSGVVRSQPEGGLVCDDNNLCTIDTLHPGVGCHFDPITAADCDDGISCTKDSCSLVTGQCSNSPGACPAPGQKCIPGSVFANPESGCVEEMWHEICAEGEVVCEFEARSWDGASGPPAGEYLVCSVHVARIGDPCPFVSLYTKCFPHMFAWRLGFDPSELQIEGIYREKCWPEFGCFTQSVAFEPGVVPLLSGHTYLGVPRDYLNTHGWGMTPWMSFTAISSITDAYEAEDGEIVGDSLIFEIFVVPADGFGPQNPPVVCANDISFGHGKPYWRNADGVFIVGWE